MHKPLHATPVTGFAAAIASRLARWVCIVSLIAWAAPGLAQDASSALYVRADSDETVVITPRVGLTLPIDDATQVDAAYVVDVWTSASIDIRTSASRVIQQAQGDRVSPEVPPITEQRDELDVGIGREIGNARLRADYRYSTEPDYESHGGSLGGELDFADRNTTLALSLSGSLDSVGRVGDPAFDRDLRTLGAKLAYTQVLGPSTMVQGVYDLSHAKGYLSSPYRFIGIGSDNGVCEAGASMCMPETNPDIRLRHAFAVRGRQAFGDPLSGGVSYRFTTDDWGLRSHTAEVDGAWVPDPDTLIGLRYRFYVQNAAVHYQLVYDDLTPDGLYTRDKELSPLQSHRIMLDLERSWALPDDGELRTSLGLGPTFYLYDDFLLDQVTAFEVTFAVAVMP